jgi:hypothetical protein
MIKPPTLHIFLLFLLSYHRSATTYAAVSVKLKKPADP